jgi:ABC-type transport system substrate-binding protein
LADVAFRHALFHCYDQEAIVASIYGYTVTPVQSLVPPAQGGWVNPSVPKHPYNPGNPITSPAGEASSVGYLKTAGYVFVDAAPTGVGPEDYWTIGGVPMPKMTLWSPTYEAAPTSAEHAARFVTDLGEIGLAGTLENGFAGFVHEPAEFADYMDKVDASLFDAYMVFWSLGRFPDHLYDMCHSSQICGPEPENKGKYNLPGINDPDIDAAVYTIKTSLDHAEKLQAAYDAQEYLYDETRPNAMGYLQLYSRIYFDGFNEDLRGIVKSPGYGADNGWTHMNLHWAAGSAGETAHTNPDGTHFINWIEGEAPERLNPCYATTVYAWDVITKTLDGLMDVDPYTHEDLTSMSSALPTVTPVGDHMEITFYIRKDVFWQDGNIYTAYDAKFNWEFFKYNKIPRYTTTWMYIDRVDIIDDYTVKVTTNMTSQFLVYDIAGLAAYLPPNVWAPLNNTGLPNILAYDPSLDTNAAGMGPWFGTAYGATTRLFGTGPWIFDYWDPVGQVWEVHQFPGYFQTTEQISADKAQMFHEVGDVNWNGEVWADDRGTMGSKYGKFWFQPEYLADADVNLDGVIDVIDLSLANFHFGELREHPTP